MSNAITRPEFPVLVLPPVDQDPHQDDQAQEGEGGHHSQGHHGLLLLLLGRAHPGLVAAVTGLCVEVEAGGKGQESRQKLK